MVKMPQANIHNIDTEDFVDILFNNSFDAIVIINHQGMVKGWNSQAQIIFGWTEQEALNKTLDLLIVPQKYHDAHKTGMNRFLSTGEASVIGKRIEIQAQRKNKEIFPIEISINSHKIKEEHYFTAFIRDISQRKESQAIIQNHVEALEAKNKDLQNFAYTASHDLQAPLRSIINFSQILNKKLQGSITEENQEYLSFVISSGKNMKSLIHDLLTFSRLGTTARTISDINIHNFLAATVLELNKDIEEKNALVEFGELPEIVRGDRIKLKQLFQNLIHNAVKFVVAPNIPKVIVESKETPDHWLFSITDNGIGIDPDYHKKIFNMFYKLHARSDYEGTGMGLAICKKIAELHGGDIWIEPQEQQGTRFVISISKHMED